MEKRKAYIIASLITLALITGLAFWYLYTAKQELAIGEVTTLSTYGGAGVVPPPQGSGQAATDKASSTTPLENGNTINNLNEIVQPSDANGGTEDEDEPEAWQLSQIHSDNVVGASVSGGKVRYTDHKTGNVLEVAKDGTKGKLSGITVQSIYNSYTISDDSTIFVHDDNRPPTLVMLDGDTPTALETEIYDNMLQIAQSGEHLYYTTPNNIVGIIIKSTEYPDKVLWVSPLSNWLLQVTTANILVTQKASNNIPGYAYILPKSGADNTSDVTPVAQDLPGLITNISSDSKQLLYSTTDKFGTVLYLKDLQSGAIIPLSIETLASKCAWSSDNVTFYCAVPSSMPTSLPDSWYKGLVHFTDSIWRINSQTGDAFELAHATGLDIIDLHEDAGGGVVIFKNKADQSLWSINKE